MSFAFTKRLRNAGIVAATLATAACSNGGQIGSSALPTSTTLSTSSLTQQMSTAIASSSRTAMSGVQSSSTLQSAYEATVLGDHPSAFFPLNDSGLKAVSLVDSTLVGVYGANVAQTGAALTTGGLHSAAFSSAVNSTANVISFLPNAELAPANTISVELWMQVTQPNTTTAAMPILSYGSKNSGAAYELQLLPRNTIGWQIHGGAPYYIWGFEDSAKALPGKAIHVVATFDGSMEHMYVNGVQTLSAKANGPLSYSNIASSVNGLTIGDDVGYGRMGINAMISNVAIYPTVLSQATALHHYQAGTAAIATPAPTTAPTSTPVPMPTAIPNAVIEAPKSVFAFENSIGFDSHFNYYSDPDYINRFQDATMIEQLPAHHLRDGGTGEDQIMASLCASGTRHSLGFAINVTAAQITQQLTAYNPACIDYVEPANEEDNVGDPNWAQHLMAEQQTIYSTIKSNPAFANIVVVGPGLASPSHYAQLPGIASITDAASIHDGECDGSPLTTHYANAAASFKTLQSLYSYSKPIYTTEFAVANNPALSGCGITPDVAAKYIPRQFLVRFNLGMPRNYMNEMSQEPSLGGWGVLGFINADATPMPAYTELHSLLSTLPSGQTASTPLSNLTYAMTGSTANVNHTLLQGSDGTYYLVVWLEVDSWIHHTKTEIAIPAQAVSLALPASVKSVAINTLQSSSYTMAKTATAASGAPIQLSVTDSPMVVSFHL